MGKVRVYDLAKELGTTSKKLIEVMEGMHIDVRNHMSTLEDDQAQQVIAILTGKSDTEEGKPQKEVETVEKQPVSPVAPLKKPYKTEKPRNKSAGAGKKPRRPLSDFKRPIVKKKRSQIKLEGQVTVGELAAHLDLTPTQLLAKMLEIGMEANLNQSLANDEIELIANEYQVDVVYEADSLEQGLLSPEAGMDDNQVARAPVVTVLGHVDHGKTSLLDAIRNANVTAGEVGGITQHIGAYQVEIKDKKIVFLDTPGHEAFTAMRARGARVTDIAILVVAADDGVMPQTVEAINHVKAAGVPIIAALNKIDKAGANPDRVKQQLAEKGLIPEEWGGDTVCVHVSAIRGDGLKELLEMVNLVAEMSELKANPGKAARGTVIEAKLDRGRGPVATVLVQDGTLRIGEPIICGTISGKVRAMISDKGERIAEAGPSTPVEVQGLNDVPMAGDLLQAVGDERIARQLAAKRSVKIREAAQRSQRITLDDLFKQIQEGEVRDLNLIIKGDVQGSVEALQDALSKLGLEDVKIKIIHTGVGSISESDVALASTSNAIIIGFNIRPDSNARKLAEQDRVDMRLYRIIYEVIDDIKAAVTGMLKPEFKEIVLGQAQVRKVFKASKLGNIAGCYVVEGKISRSTPIRLIRDGVVVHEGRLASLKRVKDDTREVLSGFECGALLESYSDIREGDILESYTMEQSSR